MTNTRKETYPHCDGCGYVEVPAPREDAEPIEKFTIRDFDNGLSKFYTSYPTFFGPPDKNPCPICGATDHKTLRYQGALVLICPSAPENQIISYDIKTTEKPNEQETAESKEAEI